MNVIVATRPEPIYSFLGSIAPSPLPLVPILILFGLAGALAAAWPMLRKNADGRRVLYPFNAVLAVVLLVGFVSIGIAFGEEIYRCEILKIPNCD